ncbi:hypothetical protein HGP14_33030 [Rhizobium sp. P32RR-XVIII]|uniref:hypothetical protein n=1 Tax=Rhizobium sp. P32RR-XVIII TaxID=2726738 RepID=UPI0014577A9F|nr:hypothetical protein [Rhizobium sp. P32RR-XVIII]NLS08032.1 hypothetical protein [Rhizobium sp. P32RR-XVIII]
MRTAREIGNSDPIKHYVKREILPGPAAGEDLDNLIRDGAMLMHHPVLAPRVWAKTTWPSSTQASRSGGCASR